MPESNTVRPICRLARAARLVALAALALVSAALHAAAAQLPRIGIDPAGTAVALSWWIAQVSLAVLVVVASPAESQDHGSSGWPRGWDRRLFWLLAAAAAGLFLWRRLRWLEAVPLTVTPEALPRLAEGRHLGESLLRGVWERSWSHRISFGYLWAFWGLAAGWSVRSYKVLQAGVSIFTMAGLAALMVRGHGRRTATAAALLVLAGSGAYLMVSYRMKWQVLFPATQVVILLLLLYDGPRRRARAAALAGSLVGSVMLYPGCLLHLVVLSLGRLLQGRGGGRRPARAGGSVPARQSSWAAAAGMALLLGLALMVPTATGEPFGEYFFDVLSSGSPAAGMVSVLGDIFGRLLTAPGGLLLTLGLVTIIRSHREPWNRWLLLYLAAGALLLIPTHGFGNDDENSYIIVPLLLAQAAGARWLAGRLAWILEPGRAASPAWRRPAAAAAGLLAIAGPYLAAESGHYTRTVLPSTSPSPGTQRYQTAVAALDAVRQIRGNRVEVFFVESPREAFRGLELAWRHLLCLTDFEDLRSVRPVSDLEEFGALPADPGCDLALYLPNTIATRRRLEDWASAQTWPPVIEELSCPLEPWATLYPRATVIRVTRPAGSPGRPPIAEPAPPKPQGVRRALKPSHRVRLTQAPPE